MAKMWAGRTDGMTEQIADDFNSSIHFDSRMYRQDITGSMAHAAMLAAKNIITKEDADQLIEGLEAILNDLDSGVILKCFPKSQLVFIGKREIMDMPIVGPVMHKMMCQFINRENDREALKTILKCIQIIKEDKASVVVFPEGYVSMDGRLRHFRSGSFKIAQKSGVPIVVCTVRNTKHVMKDLFALRKTWTQLHLVDVIDAETVKALPTTEIAEKVYEIMISDLGEQYRTDEKSMHPDLQTCIDPVE